MTRPRAKKNNDGVTGFAVVDPGGNWIRISARSAAGSRSPAGSTSPLESTGRLARTLHNAVVQADSRGDHRQAARILDGALSRPEAADEPIDLVEALVYRAEVALTLDDPTTAREMLARVDRVQLTADARQHLSARLANTAELAATIP